MHQKLGPGPFFILVNNPKQPLHARNSFKNKMFWKGIIKNLLKSKLYFFIPTQSLLMYKVIKNKRGLELMTSPSSGYKISSKLSDQIWWCNIKPFLSYSKNYLAANLCKPMHDIINYSFSICPFEYLKSGKEEEKIEKFKYLENKKNFLDEMKNIYSFWRAIICWKNKNLMKQTQALRRCV